MAAALCLLFLVSVGIRLWWVHRYYPERLADLRCFQNARSGTIPAPRGCILDCEGRALADNRLVSSLFVNPSLVPADQRVDLASALIQRLGCDPTQTCRALAATNSTRRLLIEEMTPADLERFNDLPETGPLAELMREVGVMTRELRVYPLGPLAGPVIGFTAWRDDGQVGLWGLEGRYDDVLAGRWGRYEDLRDQRGRRIPGSREVVEAPRAGTDLVLTLDADIQVLAENALSRGIERTGAVGGAVVITEPATGEVRALVSLPALDPSRPADYFEDEAALFSRATCLSYEPGSIIKIFTIAAGLEEGTISPDTSLPVTWGRLHFRGGSVADHDPSRGPNESLRDVVVHSSNRGAALIAVELGRDRLTRRLRDFGFGARTALATPGEPNGDLKEWLNPLPEIDLANMGFGQGIAVSPLQLAQAVGVFANGGVFVPLRLIEARRDPTCGGETPIPAPPVRKVLSRATVRTMESFMTGVVEEGTATDARTAWTCAGKTGTAQKPISGGYSDDYCSTFIGYGPLPNPEWLILVILDEPVSPYYAGQACGPVFREIFNALMLREGHLPEQPRNDSPDKP